MPRPLPDFLNKKFGRLLIIKDIGKVGRKRMVSAICDCGKEGVYVWNSIQQEHTKSCGCLNLELIRKRTTTHGLSKHPLFSVWLCIKFRCYNPNSIGYKDYGGRGIKMCQLWIKDFVPFYNWALANGYEKGLTIEIKNVNGNYEPSNCCWIPQAEQQRNKRTNVRVTIMNETKCLKEWCLLLGIKYKIAHQRLTRDKWSIVQVLNNDNAVLCS